MPKPPEELLTTSGAAEVLVMSIENVRRLTKLGRLPAAAVTVSPSQRSFALYRRADVEALAATRARPHRRPIPTEQRRRPRADAPDTGPATTPQPTRTRRR
jgi:hypothetical protein